MYCPSCGAEFVDGVSVCNACEVPLVEAPPVPAETSAAPLDVASVGNYPDPVSAELAAEYLRAAGIEVYVSNEHVLGLNWLFSAAVGGVDLMVAAGDAEHARQLLASMAEPPAPEDEPDEFAGGHVDPDTLERTRIANGIKVLATLLVTYPVAFVAAFPFLFRRGQPKPPVDDTGDT